jgi:hypothetical protein
MAIYWSKNPIPINVYPPLSGQQKVQLTIKVESQHLLGDFAAICTLALRSLTGESVTFQIASILDAVLEESKINETFSLTAPVSRSLYTCRRFQLEAIIVGTTTPLSLGTLSGNHTVVMGKTSHNDFAVNKTITELYAPMYSRPSVFNVKKGVPFFVTRYFPGTILPITLRYKFAKKVVTSLGYYRISVVNLPTVNTEGVFHILIDQYPADDEKPDVEIDFLLGNPAIGYAGWEYLSFQDEDPQNILKRFIFRSKKGGWETFACTGVSTEQIEVDRDIAQRNLPVNYRTDTPETFAWNSNSIVKVKVNSGWAHDMEHARWLAWELMLSNEWYEIINGERVPILLNTKSVVAFEDERFLSSLSFEYQYAVPILEPL